MSKKETSADTEINLGVTAIEEFGGYKLPTHSELEEIHHREETVPMSRVQAEMSVLGKDRARAYRRFTESQTGEVTELAKRPKVDRRRLSAGGKLVADKGPNEVEEEIVRTEQGEPLTEEEKEIGRAAIEAARRELGFDK